MQVEIFRAYALNTTSIPPLRVLQRNAWQSTKAVCHTEGVARSISKLKNSNRDISRLRAQYDKHSVIASSLDSLDSKLRGNLLFTHCGVDCHEFANEILAMTPTP